MGVGEWGELAVGSWQYAVCSWQLAVRSAQLAVISRDISSSVTPEALCIENNPSLGNREVIAVQKD